MRPRARGMGRGAARASWSDDGPRTTSRPSGSGSSRCGRITRTRWSRCSPIPRSTRSPAASRPTLDELRERYGLQARGQSPDGTEVWHNWIVRLAGGRGGAGRRRPADQRSGSCRRRSPTTAGPPTWRGRSASPWQGFGYATEAAVAMVDWLVAHGVRTVTAHVHPEHEASAGVARRVGLAPTERIEDGEVVWRRVVTGQGGARRRSRAPAPAQQAQPRRGDRAHRVRPVRGRVRARRAAAREPGPGGPGRPARDRRDRAARRRAPRVAPSPRGRAGRARRGAARRPGGCGGAAPRAGGSAGPGPG